MALQGSDVYILYIHLLGGRHMPKVMLYLDEATAATMRRMAKERGLPASRWVASLIQAQASREWPADLRKLLGSCPDFPLSKDIRATDVPDLPRVPL